VRVLAAASTNSASTPVFVDAGQLARILGVAFEIVRHISEAVQDEREDRSDPAIRYDDIFE
jgi:hypothetical protein